MKEKRYAACDHGVGIEDLWYCQIKGDSRVAHEEQQSMLERFNGSISEIDEALTNMRIQGQTYCLFVPCHTLFDGLRYKEEVQWNSQTSQPTWKRHSFNDNSTFSNCTSACEGEVDVASLSSTRG